jgi:hypothetical protein
MTDVDHHADKLPAGPVEAATVNEKNLKPGERRRSGQRVEDEDGDKTAQ